MTEFTMTEEQYNKLIDTMQAARMEVAEVKGAVGTFSANLAQEVQARAALGAKYDGHDLILRGDGLTHAGLADQIKALQDDLEVAQKDYLERAKVNAASIASLRKTLYIAAASIATPVTIDLILRLIQLAYAGKVQIP